MDKTKTLLIDMDAIVADLATEWYGRWNTQLVNKWLKRDPPPKMLEVKDVTTWDVAKTVGDGAIYKILKEPGLYRSLKPFPASQEVIKRLGKLKLKNGLPAFNIVFVTASIVAPHILTDKAEWMAEHFPFISPKQMIYAYQKELIRGDFFIDDSPKNLKNFKAAQPNAQLITIDYPYNRNALVDLRASDYTKMDEAWAAIERYLDTMALLLRD